MGYITSNPINDAQVYQQLKDLQDRVLRLESGGIQATSSTRAGGVPPKPTGLSVSTQPGVIAYSWDDSPITDLKSYRIRISESESMTGAQEFTSTNPYFTFYGGVSGVTYFAQVSTTNRSGRSSAFSETVSTGIGLVTSDVLDTSNTIQSDFFIFIEAAGTTYSINIVNPGSVTSSNFTFGPALVTVDDADSIVDLRVTITAIKNVDFPDGGKRCDLTLELLERQVGGTDASIFSQPLALKVKDPAAGSSIESNTFIPFAPPPRKPGVGDWEYRVKITGTAEGNNDIQMNFTDLRITALVFQ